jgi:hypothetical protein
MPPSSLDDLFPSAPTATSSPLSLSVHCFALRETSTFRGFIHLYGSDREILQKNSKRMPRLASLNTTLVVSSPIIRTPCIGDLVCSKSLGISEATTTAARGFSMGACCCRWLCRLSFPLAAHLHINDSQGEGLVQSLIEGMRPPCFSPSRLYPHALHRKSTPANPAKLSALKLGREVACTARLQIPRSDRK